MNKNDDLETRVLDDSTQLYSPQDDDDKTRVATPGIDLADDTDDLPTRLVAADGKSVSDMQSDNPDTEQPEDRHRILEPGTLIKNRFLLVQELGRGGMGVVYVARDLVHEEAGESDSRVAIKLLSDSFKEHPEALRMLQQETKKSRELAHPNIVTVYDFDRDNDLVYMTMELLSGQSLDAYLKQQRHKTLDMNDVIPIIADIAHGLMYAHQRNIIHSDLKPSNVFLTDKGAKVLDFGIARAAHQSDSEQANDETFIALTPSYASLEMFLGEPPDPRDDIYAFACICYQLLANSHPFKRRSAKEALEKGLVPEKISTLKERQWQALLKGLALKREQRTETVGEFIRDLLPKRRQPRKLVMILLIIMTLFSGVYYLFRPTVIVAPDLFENPPPETVLSPEQRSAVDDALEVAEVHLMVGRLLNPPGGNALDEYRKVLEMQPYNRQAIAGLRLLMQQLVVQARSYMEAGDEEHAREIVQEGLKIYHKHEALQALNQQLNQPGETSND
jgi:serine/threonine protein kinase